MKKRIEMNEDMSGIKGEIYTKISEREFAEEVVSFCKRTKFKPPTNLHACFVFAGHRAYDLLPKSLMVTMNLQLDPYAFTMSLRRDVPVYVGAPGASCTGVY